MLSLNLLSLPLSLPLSLSLSLSLPLSLFLSLSLSPSLSPPPPPPPPPLSQVRSVGGLLKYIERKRLGVELEEEEVKVPIIAVKYFSL